MSSAGKATSAKRMGCSGVGRAAADTGAETVGGAGEPPGAETVGALPPDDPVGRGAALAGGADVAPAAGGIDGAPDAGVKPALGPLDGPVAGWPP